MSNLIREKYAKLLVNYCLAVKKNDKVYINSTYLAEPLLREVAKVLCAETRNGDTVARVGGDEFDQSLDPLCKWVLKRLAKQLIPRQSLLHQGNFHRLLR